MTERGQAPAAYSVEHLERIERGLASCGAAISNEFALELVRELLRVKGNRVSVNQGSLLPCPFCGSSIVGELTRSEVRDPATGSLVPDPHAKLGVVGCGVCGCEGPSLCEPAEFVRRWNQRVRPADG